MSEVSPLRKLLQGKKTYIVSAIGVGTSILAYASGEATFLNSVYAILGALGLSALRAGISKFLTDKEE